MSSPHCPICKSEEFFLKIRVFECWKTTWPVDEYYTDLLEMNSQVTDGEFEQYYLCDNCKAQFSIKSIYEYGCNLFTQENQE